MKKTKKTMWAIALFGLLVVVLSLGIQAASAGSLGGGDSFENATQIYSGHLAEAWLDSNQEEYFYIIVKPGQRLAVTGTILEDVGETSISIYSEDTTVLNQYTIGSRSYIFISRTIFWSPNSEKGSYKLYIKVNCDYGCKSSLSVSVEDHYDAGSGTDAGDTFGTAMNISQGGSDGYLSGNYHKSYEFKDYGNDYKDFYNLSMESGEKLTATLTPPDVASHSLKIYNQDRELVNSTTTTGTVVRAFWTAPSSQDAYILVERDLSKKVPSGTYSLDISVEPPGEHNLTITAFETPSTVKQGNLLKTNVSITKTTTFEAWYTVVVSGVNVEGYPLAGTSVVKLAADSVTVPVWISIPPEAETGDYDLYADVYAAEWNKIADTGPEVVTVTA
jgi:hypothetical protein